MGNLDDRHPSPWRSTSDASEPGVKPPARPSRGQRTSLEAAAEVLRWLSEGDPLNVVGRCEAALRERSLVLDMIELALRAITLVSVRTKDPGSDPPLDDWIDEKVAEAIDEELARNREDDRAGIPVTEDNAHFVRISTLLACELGLARKACIVANELPYPERRAFFEFAVLMHDLGQLAESMNVPRSRARVLLKRALRAVAALDPAALEEADGEDE